VLRASIHPIRARGRGRRAQRRHALSDWAQSTIGISRFRTLLNPRSNRALRAGKARCREVISGGCPLTRRSRVARPTTRSDVHRNDGVRSEPAVDRNERSHLAPRRPVSQIPDSLAGQTNQVRTSSARPTGRARRCPGLSPPPPSAGVVEVAIAEIAARQSEIDNRATPPCRRAAPPVGPRATGQDFSALERNLVRSPDRYEPCSVRTIRAIIATFRGELTRKSSRHLRGDAATPGDRIDRKRNSQLSRPSTTPPEAARR